MLPSRPESIKEDQQNRRSIVDERVQQVIDSWSGIPYIDGTEIYQTMVFETTYQFLCNGFPENELYHQGGTSSGKTVSILSALFLFASITPSKIIEVFSNSIPSIKGGALTDIKSRILPGMPQVEAEIDSYNATDRIFVFRNGTQIRLRSYESTNSARAAGKVDISFCNEINTIPYDVFLTRLERTSLMVADYNATHRFYAHERVESGDGVIFNSTYHHNPGAAINMIRVVEGYRDSQPSRYRVMGLGKTGGGEGRVLENTRLIMQLPQRAELQWQYGLDFGYTVGSTALSRCAEFGPDLITEELHYEVGVDVVAIIESLTSRGISNITVKADRADVTTINLLNSTRAAIANRFTFIPVDKPPGSVLAGIVKFRNYRYILIPSYCKNAIFEAHNWMKKKNKLSGKYEEEPEKGNDHFWDSIRYANSGQELGTATAHSKRR